MLTYFSENMVILRNAEMQWDPHKIYNVMKVIGHQYTLKRYKIHCDIFGIVLSDEIYAIVLSQICNVL